MREPRPASDPPRSRPIGEATRRGKLTIFFGAAPGVGKTHAMLEVARAEMEQEKRDVVIGVAETHGRYETAALVLGLEIVPRLKVLEQGVVTEQFDLDAVLQRKPDLVVIDDLAHPNPPGSRHPKRWQDVEEVLDAGIDVFSTLDVQELESLVDLVATITGVVVRETVPDSVLERAHEVKLVDLPPDDLLERLREGKVYVPARAQRTIQSLFRKGNLIALRELLLRKAAERVDAQMRAYRRAQSIDQTWAAGEQILVAVSPSPYSARLIRAARRMVGALHARWFAVYVEPKGARRISNAAQARLSQNFRLAEQLGAEVVTLTGEDAAESILDFAKSRNVTKIVVGKPRAFRWRDRLGVSLVDRIVRRGGDIDVYVTAGDRDATEDTAVEARPSSFRLPSFGAPFLAAAVSTGVALLLFGRDQLPDVVMVYLLGIMLVSSRHGLGPSVLAALLSVAAFDFFFVPPVFTFVVVDFRHIVTFAVMFLVAIVISGLTERVRNQAESARQREERTQALYDLSRELAGAHGTERVVEIAAHRLERVFDSKVAVFTRTRGDALVRAHASAGVPEPTDHDHAVARWVWSNHREAGIGTSTLSGGTALYVPLMASGGIVGVLAVHPARLDRFDVIEQRRQVDAFAAQMALAMERAELAERTDEARRQVEAEQLRSSLLSSVSHDLRTPLAVITGAASTVVEGGASIDESTRHDLMTTVMEEAERLNRLIRNLLDMTRLESGAIRVNKEWLPLEEVVGAALNRMESRLEGRDVRVNLPADLPLVPFDAVLVEQALINLLENAGKYGADPLEIRASSSGRDVTVEIADRGPGIPEGQETRVFEKFHRAVREGSAPGVGLGLTICRAIVAAHGGRIRAENRAGGGASFLFTLPIEGAPPELALPASPESHTREASS